MLADPGAAGGEPNPRRPAGAVPVRVGTARPVVVWINGAFGAGKTTLAQVLHDRLPDALTFDPEEIGFLLRQWVPGPVTDFQDIPLWRTLTADCAAGLCRQYRRPLIVPMTVVERDYQEEIFGLVRQAGVDLVHAFLDVPPQELRRRIHNQVLVPDNPEHDAQAREFRLGNVDRCVAASSRLPAGTLLLRGDLLTPEQLADRVLDALTAHEPAGPEGRDGG